MKTQDHYTKFCAHVTAVATLDKDLVPVTNRYEVIESRMNSFMHGYVLDIPNSYAKNVCVYFFFTAAFFMCLFVAFYLCLQSVLFMLQYYLCFISYIFFSQKKGKRIFIISNLATLLIIANISSILFFFICVLQFFSSSFWFFFYKYRNIVGFLS